MKSGFDVGAGLRPARADQRPAATKIFGVSLKAREPWGPVHPIHLHRFIVPRNEVEITGGLDAIHCRIHTHVEAGRKDREEYLAKHARSSGKRD